MQLNNRKSLLPYRKRLRNSGTIAEAVLWSHLKNRRLCGKKFRRQHSFGRFILDFYCPDERLTIELDGVVHEYSERVRYDEKRTAFLEQHGIRVLRITNKQVFDSADNVLDFIAGYFDGV